jgi:hypothetical protein
MTVIYIEYDHQIMNLFPCHIEAPKISKGCGHSDEFKFRSVRLCIVNYNIIYI